MERKLKVFVALVISVILCGLVLAVAIHYNIGAILNTDVKSILNIVETETEIEETLNMTFLGECFTQSYAPISCYHDDDRNVTCYIFEGGQRGGISCIPDKNIW